MVNGLNFSRFGKIKGKFGITRTKAGIVSYTYGMASPGCIHTRIRAAICAGFKHKVVVTIYIVVVAGSGGVFYDGVAKSGITHIYRKNKIIGWSGQMRGCLYLPNSNRVHHQYQRNKQLCYPHWVHPQRFNGLNDLYGEARSRLFDCRQARHELILSLGGHKEY